jgi:predicted nucleic acid-binding protein
MDNIVSPIARVAAQLKAPPGLEEPTRQAIDANFKRVELGEAVLLESLNLPRTHRLKLPDALIWANARVNGWQLATRNTKDFPPEWAGFRLACVIQRDQRTT